MVQHYELLIIGNGPAAHRLICDLANSLKPPSSIAVIGEESLPAYNRILLSSLLAAEIEPSQIDLSIPESIASRVTQITGRKIVKIKRSAKWIEDQQGTRYTYTTLVFATGSRPSVPDFEGVSARGVIAFRSFEDLERMQQIASRQGKAVVLGGGFLGIEAAEGLRKLGVDVTLVHRSDHLLNRQLDRQAAELLKTELENRGLRVLTQHQLTGIETLFNQIKSVSLNSGERLEADLLVFATGITPNIELAADAGLSVNRGIQVNAQLQTSDPAIFALGECIEFNGQTYGLVTPIWRQSKVLASVISGEFGNYEDQAVATQLKVSGIELFSCGEIDASDDSIFYLDKSLAEYRRFWFKGDQLVGAVLYGDASLGPKIASIIQGGLPVPTIGVDLLF